MSDVTDRGTIVAPHLPETVDAIVIGTGFSGLCAAIRLREAGLSFVLLEKAEDFGGTWRDNTYPGAACDIPSHLYSLSFAPKHDWSRMYPTQPEIHAYLRDVAERNGLRDRTRFGAALAEARWAEAERLWRVRTKDGRVFEGLYLFSGMGGLHIPNFPNIPGRASFVGDAFHSAEWDHAVTLDGRRVAVIGTGASAIQFVPEIAPRAAHLDVFQRTPPWINPKMDYPFTATHLRRLKNPVLRRLFRKWIYWFHEARALGFVANTDIMKKAEKIARAHLGRQVADPVLREKLTPAYTLGCKRVLISNDYYPALSRPNVSLVTERIDRIEPTGVRTADGVLHEAEVLIYGTGFHATDSLAGIPIVGQGGRQLAESFADGMHAYYGVTVPHFPNLFIMMGPNTGLGHNSMIIMIEAQVRYAISVITAARKRRWRAVAVRPEVERAFNETLQTRMKKTVWQTGGCQSWYQDDAGRNTTLWPGFTVEYVLRTKRAKIEDYAEA